MCTQSWDGQHDWEEVGDEPHPDYPDDEDSRIFLWQCALCGRTTRTEAWQGPPA